MMDTSTRALALQSHSADLDAKHGELAALQSSFRDLEADLSQSRSDLASAEQARMSVAGQLQALQDTSSAVNPDVMNHAIEAKDAALSDYQAKLRDAQAESAHAASGTANELSTMQIKLIRAESAASELRLELGSCQAALKREVEQRQAAAKQIVALENDKDTLRVNRSLQEIGFPQDERFRDEEATNVRNVYSEPEQLKREQESLWQNELQERPCATFDNRQQVDGLQEELRELRCELTETKRGRSIAEQQLNQLQRMHENSDNLRHHEYVHHGLLATCRDVERT